MDPQQRLLLEVSWEALEHAGIIPESLRLSRTGVFVGVSSTDYVRLVSASAQQKSTIWDNTGGSSSIIANRISYFLDIQGPSIVIDTACSSSLVAVHLACRSLSTWDCDIALVGGTNVLISPEPWGGLGKRASCRRQAAVTRSINPPTGWYAVRDAELSCCSASVMHALRAGGY